MVHFSQHHLIQEVFIVYYCHAILSSNKINTHTKHPTHTPTLLRTICSPCRTDVENWTCVTLVHIQTASAA